jgi:hypothetical protein
MKEKFLILGAMRSEGMTIASYGEVYAIEGEADKSWVLRRMTDDGRKTRHIPQRVRKDTSLSFAIVDTFEEAKRRVELANQRLRDVQPEIDELERQLADKRNMRTVLLGKTILGENI